MKKFHRATRLNINRKTTPAAQPIRIWSNRELKKISLHFTGDVINISGWEDKDKEGGFYREYFPKAQSYTVSNYTPSHSDNPMTQIILDLEKPLPKKHERQYDVVLSHTNLEHIFDVFTAFKNHCKLSRDIVIVVVPFIQQQHETEEFKDYWRFTPSCLRELFAQNGLSTIYESFNNEANTVNYLLFVGSRHPKKWQKSMPSYAELYQIAKWAG
ncbi:MAG TPA: hypothetical protein VI336_00210 [Candidatus Saccharimonadales bacterium]|nr:hypothetical protein [Candidatus Saccharimonadales bacterium]